MPGSTERPDGAEGVISGATIKRLREHIGYAAGLGRKMTQEAFGEVIGVTRQHVAAMEKGRYPISEQTRILLLWLMSIYGLPGGKPPHPSIPIVIVPHVVPRVE